MQKPSPLFQPRHSLGTTLGLLAAGILLVSAGAYAQDPATPAPDAPAKVGSTLVTITKVDGANYTVGAGINQGLASGQIVPILRGPSIVALVRLSVVEDNSSIGNIVWSDESKGVVAVGDMVGLMSENVTAPPPVTFPTPGTTEAGTAPSAPIAYETGASNFSVPKADRTYELLASLAAKGLITSQPASVFQDNGARRHDYSEDFIFTRAQVAGFIKEALDSGEASSSDKAALGILVKDFRSDLLALGVTDSDLSDYTGQKGAKIGFSGFSRYRFTAGDDNNTIQPFSQRFGAARTRSGLDQRLNLFATLGSKLSFYGSLDTGTKRTDGVGDGTTIRKAYVTYDAGDWLKGLSFDIGRKENYWGVGSFGTGVLGDAAGGLNMFSAKLRRGSFSYDSLYADLGRGSAGGRRSLYGNSLGLAIGKQSRIGIDSTVLLPKDRFDPLTFAATQIGLPIYAIDQFLTKTKDESNTVVGAFAESTVAKGMRLYGEITLDDHSFNGKNRIENRNGGLVGVQLFTPKDPTQGGLKLEYSRLNSISYLSYRNSSRDADYDYYQNGAPLGYPIAPLFPSQFGGAESLRFEGYYKPAKRWTLHLGAEYSDINAEDQNPAPNGGAGFSRQQIYSAALAYDISRSLVLTARAQRVATDQPNFIKNEPSITQKLFSLEIGQSF